MPVGEVVVVETITDPPEVCANSFCLRVRHHASGILLGGMRKCYELTKIK